MKKFEDSIIYVAKNVNEVKAYDIPFYILEAGRTIEEVTRVREFCAKQSNIKFIVEFDFYPLRLYYKFSLSNYLKSLSMLMKICKRRKITTIFSSAARSSTEIVPPRVLYKFYQLIGGDSMTRREILLEIPNRQLIEKLDLGPKIFSVYQ